MEKTNFKETCANGRAGFEVMIPWEELYPYHPGLKEIGFNLCYVRALPELKTNYHYALYDDKIQNERSLRKYMPLSFEPPVTAKEKQMFATSPKNIYEGDDLKIDIMQRGSVGKVNFTIKDFISQEVKSKNFSLNDDVVKEGQITLKTTGLTQGDYALEIKGPDTLIHNFSILPKFDVKERAAKLLKIGNHISSGSLATLQFNLQEVAGGLAKLSKYDDGANLRFKMVKINLAIKNGLTGKDYLADNPGTRSCPQSLSLWL